MSEQSQTCNNCNAENTSDANYCSNCGQKLGDKLNLKLLFYNTIGNYFSFDARFFRSIIPLMFKPGYIASEFVKGRRLKYLHPGQMYLFVTVIFFFIFNFYVRDSRQELENTSKNIIKEKSSYASKLDSVIKMDSLDLKTKRELEKLANEYDIKELKNIDSLQQTSNSNAVNFDFNQKNVDSLIALGVTDEVIYKEMGMDDDAGYLTRRFYSQGLKLYKKMDLGQVFQTFIDSIPISMFILMPLFAFILKIFYYNKGNYSHHLVFSFYFFCFLFTVFSVILGVNRLFENIPGWISWLVVLSTFFYLWRATVQFYKQHWFLSFVKTSLISGIYLFFVLPLSMVLMAFIAFLYY
jgi:hypothetical protein